MDTQGNLLKARVHPADIHDRRGAELLLAGLKPQLPHITLIWADSATLGWTPAISKHWWTGLRGVWSAPDQTPPAIPSGLRVIKRRWVVERTFAWIGRNCRMSRDYERLVPTSEMLLYASMTRVMLRRLAK